MKILSTLTLAAFVLLPLALVPSAQKKNTAPGENPRRDGAGGNYDGPGDTTPNPGPATPPKDDAGPQAPPPTAGGPATNGPIYAPGASPFSTRRNPLGEAGSGGGAADAPLTPTSPPRVESPNSWQLWWHYNRWAYLKSAPELATSGSGGFYIGRGEKQVLQPMLRATRVQVQDVVQPALIRTLGAGGRPKLEIYALHALAKLRTAVPDPQLGSFHDIVPTFLQSGSQDVAEKAILSLGVRGEDLYAQWLIQILNDTPEGRTLIGRQRVGMRFRAFAAYGLGLVAERTKDSAVLVSIYDALVKALWLERVEVQAACLMALGFTPMPDAEEYIEGTELFAGKMRVDQVLELLQFFEDTEQSFVARSQVPSALARLVKNGPDSLRSRVIYALLVASGVHTKELVEVQNAAILALGELGRSGDNPIDTQVLAHLETVAYKSSADRSTRFFAMAALGKCAGRAGEGIDPFAGVEPTRKVFLARLGRSRGETQSWTALGLGILESSALDRGETPSPDSSSALRKVFEKTRSSEVSGAIAIAIGMLRDIEAEELLRDRMLNSGEANVRAYTALGLGMIGSPDSLEDLQRVLTASTNQPFVVENSAIALALLGDQQVGGKLFEILEKSSRPEIQASVASAMGWIKDPRPIGSLCEQLLDPRKNETGRAWTAVALGRICDEDAWPWVSRVSTNAQYDVWLPTLIEPQLQNGLLDIP